MMGMTLSEINNLAKDSNYEEKLYALEDALSQLNLVVDEVHKKME